MTTDETKEEFRCKLKDCIWNFRQQYPRTPLISAIDRFFGYVALNQILTLEQLNEKLVASPRILPEDFWSVLLDYIQKTVQIYWSFCNKPNERSAKSFLHRIEFLNSILRSGKDAFELVEDKVRGWRIELKLVAK